MESILMWLIYPDLRTLLNPLLLLLLDPVVIQHNFSRLSTYSTYSTYSTGHLVHPFLQHLRILTFVSFLFQSTSCEIFIIFAKFVKNKFQRSFKNIRLIKFVGGFAYTTVDTTFNVKETEENGCPIQVQYINCVDLRRRNKFFIYECIRLYNPLPYWLYLNIIVDCCYKQQTLYY